MARALEPNLARLRTPFVLTTALVSACSAEAPAPETSTSATSSQETKKRKRRAAPAPKPKSSAHCPKAAPGAFATCPKGADPCTYDVTCQSGTQSITFSCDKHQMWSVAGASCSPKYDSCPGTELYCQSGKWWLPTATNPPGPCPAKPPKEGDPCHAGGFGGVWANCGYPCNDTKTPWVVATCSRNDEGRYREGSWKYDKKCEAQ